jgi:hypothetical protein
MKRRVYEVYIGSTTDEKLRDRAVWSNRRMLATYKLPVRTMYVVEACGMNRAAKKALKLAAADGIPGAIVKGERDITNGGRKPSDDIFEGLLGI